MQMLLVTEPKKRRPKAKRDTVSATFRIAPEVKKAISIAAQKYSRSDNLQAEFLLKAGYLFISGISLQDLSDADVNEKFEELANQSGFNNDD